MYEKILIVDDETSIVDNIKFNLEKEGYRTLTAFDGYEAVAQFQKETPDLVILDVMMPGMDGYEVCRRIRETSNVPIIMVTARTEEIDTVLGLEMGADDYVAKPFSIRELMARVKAVLNRSTPEVDTTAYKGIVMNHDSKTVSIDGENVAFTRTEFELLWILLNHRDHVFSRQELIEAVWPSDVVVIDRTVDVNIARMRKKLGEYACHIASRQGYGYFFEG